MDSFTHTVKLTRVPSPAKLRANPCTSTWLKNAVGTALDRDILDALSDAEVLVAMLAQRWANIRDNV